MGKRSVRENGVTSATLRRPGEAGFGPRTRRGKGTKNRPIYNFVEIDASELAQHPDGLRDIYDRRIDGLIVHDVYSPEEVAVVEQRLNSNEPAIERIEMPWGSTIGRVLVRAELSEYHASADAFRVDLPSLV